jgi:hypothetical protein
MNDLLAYLVWSHPFYSLKDCVILPEPSTSRLFLNLLPISICRERSGSIVTHSCGRGDLPIPPTHFSQLLSDIPEPAIPGTVSAKLDISYLQHVINTKYQNIFFSSSLLPHVGAYSRFWSIGLSFLSFLIKDSRYDSLDGWLAHRKGQNISGIKSLYFRW